LRLKDFRQKLIQSLLTKSRTIALIARKRSISKISQSGLDIPLALYTLVKMPKPTKCIYCKGIRITDWPQKRVVLGDITVQNNRQSANYQTTYRCKECDIYLYKNRGCWSKYHNITWNWLFCVQNRALSLAETLVRDLA